MSASKPCGIKSFLTENAELRYIFLYYRRDKKEYEDRRRMQLIF
jgi:hypothetical protein